MKDALCKAFCDAIAVNRVPVGLAVTTGFKREDGDAVAFYVVHSADDRSLARLEDAGDTVPMLEASGVDLSSGSRAEAFTSMLDEYGVQYDPDEGLLHTEYVAAERVPLFAIRFVSFLLRVQDFLLVTRERVEETFRDDVIRAITERFAGRAQILTDEPVSATLPDYVADVVLSAPDRDPMAIFIGTSEAKALEALLFYFVAQNSGLSSKLMLILEMAKPQRIKERTLARAMNSFPVSVFRGEEAGALGAIERQFFGTMEIRH